MQELLDAAIHINYRQTTFIMSLAINCSLLILFLIAPKRMSRQRYLAWLIYLIETTVGMAFITLIIENQWLHWSAFLLLSSFLFSYPLLFAWKRDFLSIHVFTGLLIMTTSLMLLSLTSDGLHWRLAMTGLNNGVIAVVVMALSLRIMFQQHTLTHLMYLFASLVFFCTSALMLYSALTDDMRLTLIFSGISVGLLLINFGVVWDVLLGQSDFLLEKASRDPLTNLFNRRGLELKLRQVTRYLRRQQGELSVIVLDIDHFKQINDRFGHDAGDLVIRKIAQILTETCRQLDIPTRLGGEEFALILPQTDLNGAVKVAERVRQEVAAETLLIQDHKLRFSASFGVACAPLNSDPDALNTYLTTLLKMADTQLYQAKENGRNQVCAVSSN